MTSLSVLFNRLELNLWDEVGMGKGFVEINGIGINQETCIAWSGESSEL